MKTFVALLSVSAAVLASLNNAVAEEASQTAVAENASDGKTSTQQIWEGTLDVGVAQLRLRFEISKADAGEFSGKLISVDQGSAEVPLTKMSVQDDAVTMVFKSIDSEFIGKLNNGRDECVGKWSQFGKTYDFTIQRVPEASDLTHIESWQGDMVAGERTFDFQLRLEQDFDGEQIAFLDSFSEKKLGLRTEFESGDNGFEFRLDSIKATYVGKYNDDKSEVRGKWEQASVTLPLNLRKIALDDTRWSLPKPLRPQHPKPPYPYVEEQVTFRNEADDVTLSGTLTVLEGDGPFPVAILITGSGPQDRDETLFDHKPFLVIADHLTRNGIAVLRYDERGVGQSSGRFRGATTKDFANDAEAAIDFLKQHNSVDPKQVGLVGHSEGGVIAPMIAAHRNDVAFVIMLAGPGITGAEISLTQSRAMGEKAGLAAEYLDTQEQLLKALIDEAVRADGPLLQTQIDEIAERIAAKSPANRDLIESIKGHLQSFTDPWLASFITSDPGPDLQNVRCPVLALNGENDLQVLADLNLNAIESHLKAGGNIDFKIVKLPGLNHLFQTSKSGLVTEYGEIEETFAPVALKEMSDWIRVQTNE